MTARSPRTELPPQAESTLRRREARARGRRAGRAAGPAVLFVPLLLFVVSVIWLATARPKREPAPGPRSEIQVATVEGWTGRSAEGGGTRVAARLTRLHADPRRQAFESRTLANRLGLAQGEPFRLELHAFGQVGDPQAQPLSLAGLAVHDEHGLALSALPAPAPLPDDGVADPLAVLLELPAVLEPGVTAGLVLWGRAPGAGARLVGCAPEDVELDPSTLAWRGVDETLASLERAPAPEVEDGGDADER